MISLLRHPGCLPNTENSEYRFISEIHHDAVNLWCLLQEWFMKFVSFYGGFSNQVARDIRTVILDNYSLDSMCSSSHSKRRCSSFFLQKNQRLYYLHNISTIDVQAIQSTSGFSFTARTRERTDIAITLINFPPAELNVRIDCESSLGNFRYPFFSSLPFISLFFTPILFLPVFVVCSMF